MFWCWWGNGVGGASGWVGVVNVGVLIGRHAVEGIGLMCGGNGCLQWRLALFLYASRSSKAFPSSISLVCKSSSAE